MPTFSEPRQLSMYSPSGSGNVHVDQNMQKVSVGFPKGKSSTVKGKKRKRTVRRKVTK